MAFNPVHTHIRSPQGRSLTLEARMAAEAAKIQAEIHLINERVRQLEEQKKDLQEKLAKKTGKK